MYPKQQKTYRILQMVKLVYQNLPKAFDLKFNFLGVYKFKWEGLQKWNSPGVRVKF